jgi:hypothetical protein
MFLHELTPDQQRAVLILARQVIAADHRLAMQELERLEALYRETGLPAETSEAPDVVADLNYMFPEPRGRAVVLIELLLVAHADDEIHAREHESIRAIADRMQVGEERWVMLVDWAARFAALRQEAAAFAAGPA